MIPNEGIHKRLEALRKTYRSTRSIMEMMEKGTPRTELEKMKKEKLGPIEEEITRLEAQVREESGEQ